MTKPLCCDKNGLKRGPWTAEEDQKLIDYIQKHGHGRWRTLPKNAGLKRCGKSCRLRWTNYLRPDIKRGKFSIEEEETIIQLHSVLGNKWSAIASRLPGRTDNEIKNYWNTHIKKKLLRMGIDPVTHSPRLDLLELSSLLSSSLYNSTQLNNPSGLLAIGSMLNPNFLNLASTLLSNQNKTNINEITPTNVQPNQVAGNSTTTTTTTTTFQYDQSFQNLNHQISQNPTNLSNNNLPNLWQDYERETSVGINTSKGFLPMQNYAYHESDQSNIINSLPFAGNYHACFTAENSNNISSLGSFGSLISAPSSSSTPLNSSSTTTYVNNNGSSATEDVERDSYCSNMLMFDVPNGLNFNGCL